MNDKHIFYPIINRSMKNLLALATQQQCFEIIQILRSYPDCVVDISCPPLMQAIADELGRQFMRWNKGGHDDK